MAARTIVNIYKARWEIELFFKYTKQNLKIKTFLVNSRYAVLTQIWIALITMLVLAYMKFLANLGQAITEIKRLLLLILPSMQKMLFNFSYIHPNTSDIAGDFDDEWCDLGTGNGSV